MITVTFKLDQENHVPHTEELINTIIKDAFRMYTSLVKDSIVIVNDEDVESEITRAFKNSQ